MCGALFTLRCAAEQSKNIPRERVQDSGELYWGRGACLPRTGKTGLHDVGRGAEESKDVVIRQGGEDGRQG